MELRKISLEDVYPDPGNPRSKENFGDLAAMAESFALNAASPGEPFNPIVVVRDGGIYRIVDGERRYRAMRVARTASCHAVVCDDMDEANAMLAMIATDDKRQLTDVERSRGVQQMLLLGVDPEKVERAGRMVRGSSRRVRRAMERADDAAEEMTLERLLAVADLEDAGATAGELAAVSDCAEGAWRYEAARVRARIEADAAYEEMRRVFDEAGAVVLDERPDGYEAWGYAYGAEEAVGELAAALGAHDSAVAVVSRTNGRARAVIYVEGGAGDPDELELSARADELMEAVAEIDFDLARWYVSAANDERACAAVRSMLLRSWLDAGRLGDRVTDAARRAGLHMSGGLRHELVGAAAVAMWVDRAIMLSSHRSIVDGAARGSVEGEYSKRLAASWLELLRAAMGDGWSHDRAAEVMDAVASAIAEDEED